MLVARWLTLLALIAAACSRQPHDPLREVSKDVRAGRYASAATRIAAAELPDRPRLAFRAAAEASPESLAALAAAAVEPELAAAVADRLEQELGPKAALAARERAAATAPDRAEHHDALARARLANEQLDDALAAWDRAAALAPLQPTYRLSPIRALVALGLPDRACSRAAPLADAARALAATADATRNATRTIDAFLLASSATAACGDRPRAVELARAALALRPDDGRLAFTLGERLADAADPAAATALTTLLACGAHGRAWHRHEVAARLLAFATATPQHAAHVLAALDAPRLCVPVETADLDDYVASLRARIASPSPPTSSPSPPAQ